MICSARGSLQGNVWCAVVSAMVFNRPKPRSRIPVLLMISTHEHEEEEEEEEEDDDDMYVGTNSRLGWF